jgi:hypothetical protein
MENALEARNRCLKGTVVLARREHCGTLMARSSTDLIHTNGHRICIFKHHDLKSLNVFVASFEEDAPVVAKVGDFGEARISFSYSKRDNVTNPVWLAPEVLRGGNYTKAADIYSCVLVLLFCLLRYRVTDLRFLYLRIGIILWEIASREAPFREYPEGNSQFMFELEQKIRRGLRPGIARITAPQEPKYDAASTSNLCCPRYAKLVQQCWDDNPAARPVRDLPSVVSASVSLIVIGCAAQAIADVVRELEEIMAIYA